MKLISIFAAILAGANIVVLAKSCKQGGVYCGQSLLNRGECAGYPSNLGWSVGHCKA